MDDDDTGTRADNPILVVAESVAMVSRMPLADLQVREEAEIFATESDEKAGVETSVETDEAKDVESDEHQDPATNESQQDTLGDTVMGSLKRPRQCGTPGCVRTDHHPGPCTGQQVLGPRQRRPSARVLVEHETDADATEEQVAAESDDKAPPTEMPMLGPRRRKKQPPLPGWRVVRYAAPTGRDERHFKHIQTGRYARGATQMWRMEEELRGGRWSGCQIFPANTSERTREEESSCGCGCGSTRDLASEEHAAAATPQAADHDDDGDSSDDWEPGSRSRSMQGSQRKHPRRGEASSPASEASEASCTLCAWDDDEKGNEILLCDGCDAAFHQKCVAAWYKVQPSRAALCSSHPISTRSQTGALTATAPYPGACPRLSTACRRARGSAPLA